MDNYSLSDIAALSKNDAGFLGGGSGTLIILFLIIMMMGGGGIWGNGAAQAASTSDLQRAVDLNSIQTGQANIASEIQRGIYEINGNTQHVAYDNLGEIRDIQASTSNGFYNTQAQMNTGFANVQNTLTALQAEQQSCCCSTQRAIDGVNYNLATHAAAIQANDSANTQKILDAIAGNRMADMQNQINQLQLQNALGNVVRYPTTSAYCSGSNPFCGCGCGNSI